MTKTTFKAVFWVPYKTNSSGCPCVLNFFLPFFYCFWAGLISAVKSQELITTVQIITRKKVISLKKKAEKGQIIRGAKGFFI